MTTFRVFVSRLLDVLFRRSRERRLADEIRQHLDELTEDYASQGLNPTAARDAAERAFGNVDALRIVHREQRSFAPVDHLVGDLRAAVRLLVRDLTFTAGVVLVLALGLAVNTTIFTIVNGMTWRSLPVRDGHRIVQISSARLTGQREGMYTSYADFLDWRGAAQTLEDVAAYATATMNLGDDRGPAERLAGVYVSPHTFRLLGVQPTLGRDFTEEQPPDGAPIVLLGHHVWTARFGEDPLIVGRPIRINGTAMTVAGVMPPGFQFPLSADLWQPIEQFRGLDASARDQRRFDLVGRLRDGVSVEQAQTELDAMTSALAAQYPATNRDVGARVRRFTHAFVAPPPEAREPLVMMIAAAVVLLIACANGANLLLARAAHRVREMALRATLGASRFRIVRQLLVEALIISVLAAIAGLGLSMIAVEVFARETADLNLPFWIAFEFDARVFAFVSIACLGTAVAFGLLPAWQLSRTDAHEILKEGGRGVVGNLRARRWTGALLVGEIALTLMLLGAAGFLVRSNSALGRQDAVVDLDALVTAQIGLPPGRFDTLDARRGLYVRIRERLERIAVQTSGSGPVPSVTLSSARPFVDSTTREMSIEGITQESGAVTVQAVGIEPGYFQTMGLSLIAGRALRAGDSAAGREAVVINDRLAALHFPHRNPLGQRIRLTERRTAAGAEPQWFTIVGVSPSIRQRPMSQAAPLVYLPLDVHLGQTLAVTARNIGDLERTATVLREELRAVDPDMAVYNIVPARRLSELSRWPARVLTLVLALFGAIASMLSAAGLYGLTSYTVAQRTSEIGLRVALGARRSQIAWFFLRSTVVYLSLGLAFGLAGAFAAGQLLRSVLPQSGGTDVTVLAATATALVLVTSAACFVPLRRAAHVDPMTALRHE